MVKNKQRIIKSGRIKAVVVLLVLLVTTYFSGEILSACDNSDESHISNISTTAEQLQ